METNMEQQSPAWPDGATLWARHTALVLGGGKQSYLIRQTFGGYRDFGGLLVATELSVANRSGAIEFKHAVTIDEVRWDCVTEQELELPPAVRALMKS